MTKFDRGTQKVHGKLSKLSLGYIKGIPFLYFQSKGTEKVQKRYKILCLFYTLFRCGIAHSRHCLFEPSQLSSGLGDPHSVDWLIINRRQGGLNLFGALTCAVGYAGVCSSSMLSRLLGRVSSACWSAFTAELPRPFTVTSESHRSPQCICITHPVPRGQC